MTLHPLGRYLLFSDQHCYLSCADECYFAEAYLCNHKKGIRSAVISLKRSNPLAIEYFAEKLTEAVPREWAAGYTFVAMPRSSAGSNALRLVLRRMPLMDCRDLLLQKGKTPASHTGWRPSPTARAELYYINTGAAERRPNAVVLFDDVVTTGSHFRAAKIALRKRWPDLHVVGLFLARVCSWQERCRIRTLQGSGPLCFLGMDSQMSETIQKR